MKSGQQLEREALRDNESTNEQARPRTTAAQGSVALIGSFAVIAVLNYGFGLAMAWLLRPAAYGVLGVSQTVLMILSLVVNAGFPRVVLRAVSSAGWPLPRDTLQTIKTALRANLGLAALGGTVIVLLYLLQSDVRRPETLGIALLLLATGLVLSVNAVLASLLGGLFRFRPASLVSVIEVVVKVVGGLSLVVIGYGAAGAIAGFLIGAIIATLLAAFYLRDLDYLHTPGWQPLRTLHSSVPMFLGVVALGLLSNLDILVLKLFAPASQSDSLAGIYQAAVILARIPIFIATSMMTAVFSFMSRDAEQPQGAAGVRIYALVSLKYAALFLLPLNVIFITRPDAIISVFFPRAYAESSLALAASSVGTAALVLVTIFSFIFQATGKPEVPARILPLAVVLEVLLGRWLVPAYSTLGAAGALTISSTCALVALFAAFRTVYTFHISLATLGRYTICLALLVALLLILPASGGVGLVLSSGGALAIYLLALVLAGLLEPGDIKTLAAGMRLPDRVTARVLRLFG